MGTRVMNEYSYPEGQYASSSRQRDLLGEAENVSARYEVPKKDTSQNEQILRVAGLSIGFCSIFTEQLISHPCIVLRRQCQVHHNGKGYHLTPFTLIQTLLNLQRTQGGWTLWKGIGGVFVVRGINLVSENIISEVTPFPKDVSRHSSLKKYGEHILLKAMGIIVTTPFYAASLIETVQSDIASEKPGIVDVVREGVSRVAGWGAPHSGRLIPVWQLVGPTVALRLSHYLISAIANYTVISTKRSELQERRDLPGETSHQLTPYEQYFPELLASFTGQLLADFVLYPLETVVYRLYIQGTRTIIDNTDTGLGVVPISTRYEGFLDCFRCIFAEEGIQGFYRGFGALVLQYMAHALILRTARLLFERLSQEFGPPPPPPPIRLTSMASSSSPQPLRMTSASSIPGSASPSLYSSMSAPSFEKSDSRHL
ncbi:mitochondrial outer membrane protein SLC25A46-like [Babylonia areolata]|uniref:mitochondrial outer membrane protein SLC25A46-like n=1 Tax=Babylonia areolata TaxID=304850 RepID=UPI003FCEFA1F